MAEPILKDLAGLVASMKGDLFARWMRRAQKQALMEWRDRKQAPGLAARFEKSGEAFYGFSKRAQRRRLPAYVHTGRLRDSMKKRKPRSMNNRGTDVVTNLKFGGGALNFLTDSRGVASISKSITRVSVSVSARQRAGAVVTQFTRPGGIAVKSYNRSGGIVAAHTTSRQIATTKRTFASQSYSAEFGAFFRDQPWISKRVEVLFAQIARKASIDRRTGGIKSSVLEGIENVG